MKLNMELKSSRSQLGRGLGNRVKKSTSKGFTLIEITAYLAMTMILSMILLMMLQSHFTFMRILSSYEFLRDDAPQVNVMLTGILGKADSYRIYGSAADAKASSSAVNSGGRAVRLRFRNPNGTIGEGIVAFEVVAGEGQLNYYNFDGGWPASADWTISHRPTIVDFADNTGVLLVTLTGPYNETITYAGTGE